MPDCAKRSQFAPGGTRPEGREMRAKCAKRTQFDPACRMDGSLGGQMCKTKPISTARAESGEDAQPTKSRRGRTCKTNPIPGGAGWNGARGTRGVGLSRQTKPIPNSQDRGGMCKTNPICRRRVKKTIAKAFGLDAATRRRRGQTCKTKPISRRGRLGRGLGDAGRGVVAHKRSQSPAGGISQYSTILLFRHSSPMARVQTKPILLSWAHVERLSATVYARSVDLGIGGNHDRVATHPRRNHQPVPRDRLATRRRSEPCRSRRRP